MAVNTTYWIGSLGEIAPYMRRIYDARIPLLVKRTFSGKSAKLYALDGAISNNTIRLYPSKEKDPLKLERLKLVQIQENEVKQEEDDIPSIFVGIELIAFLNLKDPLPWTKSEPHEVPPRIVRTVPVFQFSSFDELALVYNSLERVALAPSKNGPWEIYETYETSRSQVDEGTLYVKTKPYYYREGERQTGEGSDGRITRAEMETGELHVALVTEEDFPKDPFTHCVRSVGELTPSLKRIYEEQEPLILKRGGIERAVYACDSTAENGSLMVHFESEGRLEQITVHDDELTPPDGNPPQIFLEIEARRLVDLQKPPAKPEALKEKPAPVAESPPVVQFESFDELRSVYRDLKEVLVAPCPNGPWKIYMAYAYPHLPLNDEYLSVECTPIYKGRDGKIREGWGTKCLITRAKMDLGRQYVGLQEEPPKGLLRRRSKSNPEKAQDGALQIRRARAQTVNYASV